MNEFNEKRTGNSTTKFLLDTIVMIVVVWK